MIADAERATWPSIRPSIRARIDVEDSSGRNGSSSQPSRMSMTCAFWCIRASSDAAKWGDSGGLDEMMTSAHRARSCAFGDRSVAIVQPIVGSGIRWRPQPRLRAILEIDDPAAVAADPARTGHAPKGSEMNVECGASVVEVLVADRLRTSQLSAESHAANRESRRPP